jgi:hypothetical protein
VQQREDDVDVAQRLWLARYGDRERPVALPELPLSGSRRELPAAVATDVDRANVVAFGIQRLDDGAGGSEGDVVLARAPALDDRDAKPVDRPS